MDIRNQFRITQTAPTVRELMGIGGLEDADICNPAVLAKAASVYGDQKLERVLMYNPDAIALWLYQKYTDQFIPVMRHSDLALPVCSVMPSVTPVCFASMYSGLDPERHGIKAYVKPVLKCETLFDALIKAGKKPVIISTAGDSISEIFKEREMEYIFCETPEEVNEQAERILKEDRYDLITLCFFVHAQKEELTGGQRLSGYLTEINPILTSCGMSEIHPANPYEAFILICILSDCPLAVYGDIWELSYEQ